MPTDEDYLVEHQVPHLIDDLIRDLVKDRPAEVLDYSLSWIKARSMLTSFQLRKGQMEPASGQAGGGGGGGQQAGAVRLTPPCKMEYFGVVEDRHLYHARNCTHALDYFFACLHVCLCICMYS